MRVNITFADRTQRLLLGLLLLGLNIYGLIKSPEFTKWLALALQIELIGTGLIGWCPVTWVVGRRHHLEPPTSTDS